MSKKTFVKILKVADIALVVVLVICFLYKSTLVISEVPNMFYLGRTGTFNTYSFFDGVIKINLVFVVILFVVLQFLKRNTTEMVHKKMVLPLISLVAIMIISNLVHAGSYDLKYYWYQDGATTEDEYMLLSDGFKEYLPFFLDLCEITEQENNCGYYDSTTPLGYCIYFDNYCEEFDLKFVYEEIQTKSKLALLQFIITKGRPYCYNELGEEVYMESVNNSKYDCKVYNYQDFYEIWFVEFNNCTIIRYENFDDAFNMTEEEILKHAKDMYDKLHGKYSENQRFVNWEYATW